MTLQHGASGDDVSDLQLKLKAVGHDPGHVDGVFGHGTEHAVRSFQHACGLVDDGIAGPHTMEALERAVAAAVHTVGTPALDVWYEMMDSSCEWVTFVVYNAGNGDAAERDFHAWITVQPEHSGHAVRTYREELPAIAAGQQTYSTVRLPDTLDNGNYDIHVGLLDSNNQWVTQQPHIVRATVHDRRFSAR
jgi:peptidoglycan hydrolase-like protein with peptidoglycan-binding domain